MAENETENKPATPVTPAAPRPLRFQPIQPKVMPSSTVQPGVQAPMAGQTPGAKPPIQLRPVGFTRPTPQSTAFVPPPAGAQAPRQTPQAPEMATDTSRLLRRTIRMVPPSQQTATAPKAAPAQGGDAMATDTSRLLRKTIRLTPPPANGVAAAPAATGAQPVSPTSPTMKVTPTSQGEGTHAMPTIKLGGNAATGAPHQTIKLRSIGTAAGQPKVKLSSDHPTIKISRPSTLHKPGDAMPSSPTIKLGQKPATETSVAEKPAGEQPAADAPVSAGQRTIKLGVKPIVPSKNEVSAPDTTAASQPDVAKTDAAIVALDKTGTATKAKTDVLSLAFAIAALIAIVLTCVIYYVQYSNFYNGTSIQLPGLSTTSGK